MQMTETGTQNNTVLIVEDEPHIAEALSFLLSREGTNVSVHDNGEDAAQVATDLAPHLVILDVMLPNKSGFEILSEMREQPTLSATPVLMLTAKGQAKDRQAAQDAGVSMFMTKPFSNREIVENVKTLLG